MSASGHRNQWMCMLCLYALLQARTNLWMNVKHAWRGRNINQLLLKLWNYSQHTLGLLACLNVSLFKTQNRSSHLISLLMNVYFTFDKSSSSSCSLSPILSFFHILCAKAHTNIDRRSETVTSVCAVLWFPLCWPLARSLAFGIDPSS